MVEIGGKNFVGEPAKTKKQAEKNAAQAAWSALKHVSSTSQFPLLSESTDTDARSNTQTRTCARDEGAALVSSSSQGPLTHRSRGRSVIIRERKHTNREVHPSSIRQYYPAVHASTPVAGIDGLGYDGYQTVYNSNQPSLPSSREGWNTAIQQFSCPQSSYAGSAWFGQSTNNDKLESRQHGWSLHHSQFSSTGFGGVRDIGNHRHRRRHSVSGMESPTLAHEAMNASRASGGGSIIARVSPGPQQIRGLPYQSLSERFELNRPMLLEELQLKDDEDDWVQRGSVASSTHRNCPRRKGWQSQSERFEYRNHFLPQVEESLYGDEEDWQEYDSYINTGFMDRGKGPEKSNGHGEGWLRGEALLQNLEEQKNLGYQEGWLRETILKHNRSEKRPMFNDNWVDSGTLNACTDERSHLNHTNIGSQSHNKAQIRAVGVPVGSVLEKEKHASNNEVLKDVKIGSSKHASFSSQVGSIASASSSPFTSLWAKSTQWWGSNRSSSSSSAVTSAVASTFGLRPAASIAPAVRVRHAVPVCSAPPRCSEALSLNLSEDQSASLKDAEANVRQVFNSLRL
ncbi:hypothetical protein KP509_19G040500 [Ceratopteris richardii]|nr:hypothetical protein KP509_19G040500 [Ceratopteris richardii]